MLPVLFTMEEKLDKILNKLEVLENRIIYCENILRKIDKNTEESFKHDAKEFLLNVLGDIAGNLLIPERKE